MHIPVIMPTPSEIRAGGAKMKLNAPTEIKTGCGLTEECAAEFAALWKRFALGSGEAVLTRCGEMNAFEAVLGVGAQVSLKEGDEYALSITDRGACIAGRDPRESSACRCAKRPKAFGDL